MNDQLVVYDEFHFFFNFRIENCLRIEKVRGKFESNHF